LLLFSFVLSDFVSSLAMRRLAWSVALYIGVLLGSLYAQTLADRWGFATDAIVVRDNDLGIYFLGTPFIGHSWMPELSFALLYVIMIYALFVDPNAPKLDRWHGYGQRLSLFFNAHSAVLAMRMTTVCSTVSLRSHRCHNGKDGHFEIFNNFCHDLNMSGHVATEVLTTCFILASRLPLALRAISLCMGIAGPILTIMVGDHYTADCLFATYISILVFLVFRPQLHKAYHYNPDHTHRPMNHNHHAVAAVTAPHEHSKDE
jgi:hypothetical protein